MKTIIRAKIDAALAARGNSARPTASSKIDNATAQLITDAVVNGEKLWKIQEIADRTNQSWGKVRRDLCGQAGFLSFDGEYRITDTLFRRYVARAATTGLTTVAA